SEGLEVDAMSPGEIYMERMAGFTPEQIFYICNNVSAEEMQYAIDEGVLVSVDSLSQLEQFGQIAPGHEVAIRFNPGVGAGHHEKVVTAGKKTKFGIEPKYIPEVKELLAKYDLKLVGINQHIGSLFMSGEAFVKSIRALFEIAKEFKGLRFVDMGGGFGIPYKKEFDEAPLDLKDLGSAIDKALYEFAEEYGEQIIFRIEPGRYISAESNVILSTVHSVKHNHDKKFVGCDCGFNVLQRPIMYDSYHGVEVYRASDQKSEKTETVSIVGNICESGDILAKDRELPEIYKDDVLGILDAGAYGFTMASNYNNRLRPAEIMIRENGEVVLTREREVLSDLMNHVIPLKDL
ncbi:MAG: diaminopimelate decarboxylase, partial [Muricoprocola sp.]